MYRLWNTEREGLLKIAQQVAAAKDLEELQDQFIQQLGQFCKPGR
jgi:hypothetical protein